MRCKDKIVALLLALTMSSTSLAQSNPSDSENEASKKGHAGLIAAAVVLGIVAVGFGGFKIFKHIDNVRAVRQAEEIAAEAAHKARQAEELARQAEEELVHQAEHQAFVSEVLQRAGEVEVRSINKGRWLHGLQRGDKVRYAPEFANKISAIISPTSIDQELTSLAMRGDLQGVVWSLKRKGYASEVEALTELIEDELVNGKIINESILDVRFFLEGNRPLTLVEFDSGLKGVFDSDWPQREIAAYKLDQLLRWNKFTITVPRQLAEVDGSVRLFDPRWTDEYYPDAEGFFSRIAGEYSGRYGSVFGRLKVSYADHANNAYHLKKITTEQLEEIFQPLVDDPSVADDIVIKLSENIRRFVDEHNAESRWRREAKKRAAEYEKYKRWEQANKEEGYDPLYPFGY